MKLATTMIFGGLLAMAMLTLTDSAVANGKKSATKTTSSSVKEPVREEPPIMAGAAIKVVGFNSSNRTLEVKIVDEPAVGPNITKPESLLSAIGFDDEGDRKRFLEEPRRFVGGEYVLKADLQLIAPETLKKK